MTRTVLARLVLVLAAAAALPAPPARADEGDARRRVTLVWEIGAAARMRRFCRTCPPRRWRLCLEAGVSLLPSPQDPIGVAAGDPTQLRWDDLDLPPGVALRVGAEYALNRRDRIVLRAAWHGPREDAYQQDGVIGFTTAPGAMAMATPANTATVRAEAESQTGELGWWRNLDACGGWCLDAGLALRILHFHEPTQIRFTNAFPGVGAMPAQLDSLGHNLFFGIQPGVRARRTIGPRLKVFAGVKAFAGTVLQDLEVSDANLFTPGAHEVNRDRFTFGWGAEVEIGLRRPLSRCWALTASYTLVFFDGVVRGADAYDFFRSATGQIQARFEESTLLVHTLFLGATYDF
jgi:hypothetical protein